MKKIILAILFVIASLTINAQINTRADVGDQEVKTPSIYLNIAEIIAWTKESKWVGKDIRTHIIDFQWSDYDLAMSTDGGRRSEYQAIYWPQFRVLEDLSMQGRNMKIPDNKIVDMYRLPGKKKDHLLRVVFPDGSVDYIHKWSMPWKIMIVDHIENGILVGYTFEARILANHDASSNATRYRFLADEDQQWYGVDGVTVTIIDFD